MTYDKKYATPSFRNALAEVLNGGKKVEETPVEPKEVELSEDDNLETLTEEELFQVMEEELGPHIAYLLDEGFSEDEVETIIVEMLESSDDEEELVEKKKEKKEKCDDEDDEDEDKD